MSKSDPVAELDGRYSEPSAQPVSWADAGKVLANAQMWWISTVRPDGRPHVTPLFAIWTDSALHFCTGPHERKRRNLAENPKVVLTTGDNTPNAGLDLIVEGAAVRVTDQSTLARLADLYAEKYGEEWRFSVVDDGFADPSGQNPGWVYAVEPSVAFSFGKSPYSQTRYRF